MEESVIWSGHLCHTVACHTVASAEQQEQVLSTQGPQWTVLVKESAAPESTELRLYHTRTDHESGHPAATVLCLDEEFRVERDMDTEEHPLTSLRHVAASLSPLESFVHKFTISTAKETHTLAARTSEEAFQWTDKLNNLPQKAEREFRVRILPTPLSREFALQSRHILKISSSEISLNDISGTVPPSLSCPRENITKVDCTHGAGSGVMTLHCINIQGTTTSGALTFSTDNTAELSKILNCRHSTTPPSTHSLLNRNGRQQQQNHYATFGESTDQVLPVSQASPPHRNSHSPSPRSEEDSTFDITNLLGHRSKLYALESLETRSLPSSLNAHDRTQQLGQQLPSASSKYGYHSSTTPLALTSSLNKLVIAEREMSSSSDEDDLQPDDTISERKESGTGSDFESLSSWFSGGVGTKITRKVKRENAVKHGRNSVHRLPNSSPSQSTPLSSNSHQRPLKLSTGGRSSDGRLVSVTLKDPSEYLRGGVREYEESPVYCEATPRTLLSKKKESLDESLLERNEAYEPDIDSWRVRPSVTNGNGHQYTSIGERQPQSLGDYEVIKDSDVGERKDASTPDPDPDYDYDYVKNRILGVRGPLPPGGQVPPPQLHSQYSSSDSDDNEDEPYYY